MPTKEAIHGKLLFQNSRLPVGLPVYGQVLFYNYLETRKHPSIYGQVRFIDIRHFPPLGVTASYRLVESPAFDTLVVEFGRHLEQRLAMNSDVRWSYRLRFETLPPAQAQLVMAFFVARKGDHQPFTLFHPKTGEQKICRFAKEAAEFTLFSRQLYTTNEIDVIEVAETFY